MRRLIIVGVLFLALLLAITLQSASARNERICACINNKTGKLRIADTCKANEKRLCWNEQGPEGPQGEQGETGPSGIGCFGVYDGNGVFLGHLVDVTANEFHVYDPDIPATYVVANYPFPPEFRFDTSDPEDDELRSYFYFTSTDCTGTPYAWIKPHSLSILVMDPVFWTGS